MVVDLRELIKVRVPPPADVRPEVRVGVTPVAAAAATALAIPGNGQPIGPADPGYRSRIPPGAPDGTQEAANAPVIAPVVAAPVIAAPVTPKQRLAIMFGKKGKYGVAVEVEPDWDFEGDTIQVSAQALRELYPILCHMVKIKDQTGGAFLDDDDEPA